MKTAGRRQTTNIKDLRDPKAKLRHELEVGREFFGESAGGEADVMTGRYIQDQIRGSGDDKAARDYRVQESMRSGRRTRTSAVPSWQKWGRGGGRVGP